MSKKIDCLEISWLFGAVSDISLACEEEVSSGTANSIGWDTISEYDIVLKPNKKILEYNCNIERPLYLKLLGISSHYKLKFVEIYSDWEEEE